MHRATLVKFLGFTVVCIIMGAVLVMMLTNMDPFADRREFQAVMPNTGGLLENDPVKIAGVDVGRVESIDIEQGNALVTFTVDADREIGQETTLGIRWRNLLGLRYLYVYPEGGGDLEDGYTFEPERVRTPVDLTRFMGHLAGIYRALDPEVSNVVVNSLAESLAGREEQTQQIVEDAASLLSTIGDRSDEVGRVITNGAHLLDAYAAREQELRSLISSFADVSSTVAERNDELVNAVVRIADGASELERLIAANETHIRGSIGELDAITQVLAQHHADLENIFSHTGIGIVQYHRVTRWGQWFNIRAVGLSSGEETMTTERGAALPERTDPQDGERRTGNEPPNSGAFFRIPSGGVR
jgi:phospholipid/cholesterol/gamma-HCH transport system substrate-binding protein